MRETIFLAVCNALGVDYRQAASKCRKREYVVARQMYIALMVRLYGKKYRYWQIAAMPLFEIKYKHNYVCWHLRRFNDEIDQPFMAENKAIFESLIEKFKSK